MKNPFRFAAPLVLSVLAGACGSPDTRSFAVENVIFEALVGERAAPPAETVDAETRARVARGLSAVCKGDTAGARQLIRDGGIGTQIYRLLLIAAKAARDGSCDYTDWPEKHTLLGDRFKQLVNSGDAAAVLLAALLDNSLTAADRAAVVKALSDRKYGQAEVVYAGLLLTGEGVAADPQQARTLLEDAARQGADPAWLLLARLYRDGLGTPRDLAKACAHFAEAARRGSAAAADERARLACPPPA